MKKRVKILSVLVIMMLTVIGAAACGEPETEGSKSVEYDMGFISSGSTVEDDPVENAIWQSVILFGENNGNSHRYYIAETHDQAAYLKCIESAVSSGTKVIITEGYELAPVVRIAQQEYPDVDFIHIQGSMDSRNGGKGELKPASNTLKISFCEEQAGFLAGYGCVKDKKWELAVIGDRSNAASRNYAAGFIQGADKAAEDMGISDVTVKCKMYRNTQPLRKVRKLAARFYRNGTEAVFVCDGTYNRPVAAAAENNDGLLICAETDMSGTYENVLSTAARDYTGALNYALTKHFDNKFPGGKSMRMGAGRDAVMLPLDNSKFDEFSEGQYEAVFERIASGSIKVKDGSGGVPAGLSPEIVSVKVI